MIGVSHILALGVITPVRVSNGGGGDIEQENIAKVIYVTPSDIDPFEGTLEERIALYINDQSIEKLATDAEIWVEYNDEQAAPALQAVNITVYAQSCPNDILIPEAASQLFYSEQEDRYYMDVNGTIPASNVLIDQNAAAIEIENVPASYTITNGFTTVITCK